ncbi:hypothetical protein NPS70_00745 [Streptomyces sp. C10-9-1]|uniref:hypothetical protein n=1 Tax=Streptomyces sp. C10-9-1 TaxID=1859285 RepID=UPI00211197E1|nr:hypothetical protein [Streptomyces sp. C10-9-1]MCQ6551732.1 hypothetical protein [Streptomyces sp. C10-9-1]
MPWRLAALPRSIELTARYGGPTAEQAGESAPPTGPRTGRHHRHGADSRSIQDFNGNGKDDILWYGPGSAHDSIWCGTTTKGRFPSGSIEVKGTYTSVP